MKNTKLLLSLAIGVSMQANAIDFFDHESIPSNYATVEKVVDEENDQVSYNITFKQDATAWRPAALNAILSSYGIQLEPKVAGNLPSDFGWVVEVVQAEQEMLAESGQGELQLVGEHADEYEINYSSGAVVWRTEALHNILTSYNLEPDPEQFENFPSDYATVVMVENTTVNEQTGEEQVVEEPALQFGTAAVLWRPAALHKIISGYRQDPDVEVTELVSSLSPSNAHRGVLAVPPRITA